MQPPLLFGLGSWLAFAVASVVSIYAFDQFEHAWGRGGSLQVEIWVGLLGGFICMVAFGFSAAFTKRVHTKVAAFQLGIASGITYIAICGVVNAYVPAAGVVTALVLLLAVAGIASQIAPRYAG